MFHTPSHKQADPAKPPGQIVYEPGAYTSFEVIVPADSYAVHEARVAKAYGELAADLWVERFVAGTQHL